MSSTASVREPVEVIGASIAEWEAPHVELAVFGTASAEDIADRVDRFCSEHLGARLSGYLFYGSSVGSTQGVELSDGRRAVIKARPPPSTNPDLALDERSLCLVHEAMEQGRPETWDVRPQFDPSSQYVRQHDAQETSRRRRYPRQPLT